MSGNSFSGQSHFLPSLSPQGHPVLLTIAGFDPSSGAGITADLKVFAAHGCFGVSCITALTVQNTIGVQSVWPVDGRCVGETLAGLHADLAIAGVKIGMLANRQNVQTTSKFLASAAIGPATVVLDPVLVSTSGKPLLEPDAVACLSEQLLPVVGWITPNLEELGVLTGMTTVEREAIPEAAQRLRDMASANGNRDLNILVTGGHLERPDDFLLPAHEKTGAWVPGELVATTSTHGTGCALSSAVLCSLVAGKSPQAAVSAAKRYVEEALRCAYKVGQGRGPMHHLYALDETLGLHSS